MVNNNYAYTTSTQAGDQRPQPRGPATYNERPFKDLVDEENFKFVTRRVIGTLFGGYRFVFNEADDDSLIPWHLHFLQLIVYLIMPAVVVIFTQGFANDRNTGVVLGGIIPMALNTILQFSSYLI